MAPQAQQAVSFLLAHGATGERLFVGPHDLRHTFGSDIYLYHLLPQLTPATYFLEMNPRSATRPGSRLAGDVASADWLVLNRAWDECGAAVPGRVPGSDAPNEIVRTQFAPAAVFEPFYIYHRRRVAASR